MTDEQTDRPETCRSVGTIQTGGKTVGFIRCELNAGHEVFGVAHCAALEWTDDAVLSNDWPESVDPGERFDVEV